MSSAWFQTGSLTLALLVSALPAQAERAPSVPAPAETPTAAAPAPGAETSLSPQVARVLALLGQRNAELAAYSFDLQVKLAMHTFPWLQPYLIGSGTYQKPGHYTVTFKQVPALARNYQRVTGEMLDPSSWPQKYVITMGQESASEAELILHERVKGEITEARAIVDTSTGYVKRMRFRYEHGGTIDIVQHSIPVQGFILPSAQDAEIAMPGIKATGHATFTNYHLTVDGAGTDVTDHLVRK